MTETTAYIASQISIALMFVGLFWLYRDYRVDKFRQKLFKLRDSLFDAAASGSIDFDNEAYVMLRSTMNGAIRFGHRFNLLQMFIYVYMTADIDRPKGSGYGDRLASATESFSDEQKTMVKSYHDRMNFIVLEHMILTSPLLLLTVLLPLAFIIEAKKHISTVVGKFETPLEKFDDAALIWGR